jgi:2-methylisocitrate lyase-like PEP mutase family enzyme
LARLSRRDFAKNTSLGALSGLTATSFPALARAQGEASTRPVSPKRTTTLLREMIKSPGVIDSPGIHDPLTARIAESVGFGCVNLSGPGLGVVTCEVEAALGLEDLAEATHRITNTIKIPLLVDAGGGFGEPAHVFHTARVLEHAGAAGLCVDDQVCPKRFHYYMDGRTETIPIEQMVEKIRYAVQARRDPDFVIGACTATMQTHGFAECIRRANLCLQAGADYVLLFPRTVEETKRIPKEVQGPLSFANAEQGMAERQNFTAQELGAMGWKILNHPSEVGLLYYKMIKDALLRLKETGTLGMDASIYGPVHKEVYQMIGLNTYYVIEYWTSRLGSRGAPGTYDPEFQPK